MIVYGAAAQESVPRLYAAGVLPGLLIAALLALYVIWFARRHGIGATESFDVRRLARSAARGVWALGAPVIILGGIYGGVFSPTEAAGIARGCAAPVSPVALPATPRRAKPGAAEGTARFTPTKLL